jgi:hypothetical protein
VWINKTERAGQQVNRLCPACSQPSNVRWTRISDSLLSSKFSKVWVLRRNVRRRLNSPSIFCWSFCPVSFFPKHYVANHQESQQTMELVNKLIRLVLFSSTHTHTKM